MNINMVKNTVLMLHEGNKIVKNHDKNPTKPVLPVSYLWGWYARKVKTQGWAKEFLNHNDFFLKGV